MRAEIEAYMAACPTCQRVIDRTTAKPGLLKSLLIPMESFICYNMDFFLWANTVERGDYDDYGGQSH